MRDLVLLLCGAVAGYFYATQGRRHLRGGMVPALPDAATDFPARFSRYYQTHTNEVLVGAVLVGIILYLMYGKKGAAPRRAKK